MAPALRADADGAGRARQVPAALGCLSRLERLHLDANLIASFMPESENGSKIGTERAAALGGSLTLLSLAENRLAEVCPPPPLSFCLSLPFHFTLSLPPAQVPAALRRLSALTHLVLDANAIAAVPAWLPAALPALRLLSLSANALAQGALPSEAPAHPPRN